MDESQLINQLRQRDPQALEQVFKRYSNKIYRLALSLLHDEVQSDGVVQDTFLKLIEHIDQFEGRSSIGTWLYRVAYNECQMRLRRSKPTVAIDTVLEETDVMPACLVNWDDAPEQLIYSSEAMSQMELAIQTLSPALRAVFVLRDLEELSTREAADILNITEAAVKVRLHRARLLLREQLATYFEDQLTKANQL